MVENNPADQEVSRKRTYSVFRFFGEALVFDLINTEIRTMKGKYLDLLGDPVDLQRWWHEVLPYYPEQASSFKQVEVSVAGVDETLLETTKYFRKQLRQLFSNLIDHQPLTAEGLAELNRVLKNSHQQIVTTSDGEIELVYEPSNPRSEGEIILTAVALSASSLLSQTKQYRRLRKCKNERCIGMFYDNTKSATRHWCHINCKDRARAAERYQQSKI